jgi:upstream activation factor subunit UAF30
MPSPKTNTVKGRASGALARPVQPDEALAAVVGAGPLPRTEITKRVWAYIRERNLQDPQNRRNVNADETLRALFDGKTQVTMFELAKLVNGHVR